MRLVVRLGPIVLLEDPSLATWRGSLGAIQQGDRTALVLVREICGAADLATARARGAVQVAGQSLAICGLGSDDGLTASVIERIGCVPLRLLWQRVRARAITVPPEVVVPLLLDSVDIAEQASALGIETLSLDDAVVGLHRIVLPPRQMPATFSMAESAPWDAQVRAPAGVTRLPAITAAGRAAFALLTGREPVGASSSSSSSFQAERLATSKETPVPVARLRPDVPSALAAVIDAVRSPVDAERPLSWQALRDALTGLVDVAAARASLTTLLEAACSHELKDWALLARELAATPWRVIEGSVSSAQGWRALPLLPPSSTGGWSEPTEDYRRPAPTVERWPGDDRDMARIRPGLRMDVAPVSRAAFARFVVATGYNSMLDGRDLTPDQADAPVVDVDIEDARAYARYAHKRLPLQPEWQEGIALLGLSAAGGGRIWEWTASRYEHGHVVRGGPLRDDEPGVFGNRTWEAFPRHDVGFRCVVDG